MKLFMARRSASAAAFVLGLEPSKNTSHGQSHDTALAMLAFSVSGKESLSRHQLIHLPSIVKNEWGKPFFSDRSLPFFNWSHSGDWVFLAISDSDVGADIEVAKNRSRYLDIADRFFSKEEAEAVHRGGEDVFFLLWTIREAALKLSGRGLAGSEELTINPVSGISSLSGKYFNAAMAACKEDEFGVDCKLAVASYEDKPPQELNFIDWDDGSVSRLPIALTPFSGGVFDLW